MKCIAKLRGGTGLPDLPSFQGQRPPSLLLPLLALHPGPAPSPSPSPSPCIPALPLPLPLPLPPAPQATLPPSLPCWMHPLTSGCS